jgi:predicted dehydrogenase
VKGVIVGAGYFAGFHAEAWNRLPGVKIAGAADPDIPRVREFASRWNIPAVYASAEEAIDAERPDFVDIATRPEFHLPLTAQAAELHVPAIICQKPMAPTPEAAREMVTVCERAGTRLVIHENWRWQPWYREAKRLASAGEIGRLFHIGFTIRIGDGRGPEPYTVQPYFRTMPRLLVYETLVHHLDTARFFGGEFEDLCCRIARINPLISGEDYAVVHGRLSDGATMLIDANRISGSVPPPVAFGAMRLEGDAALIRIDEAGALFLTPYGGEERRVSFPSPTTGYKGDAVLAMQRHFIDCIRSGRPAESEGRDYLKTVDAVEACYRSAASLA